MGAARILRQWTASVNQLFGSLHGHTVKSLACFSLAMCQARHCHSGKLAASAPADAKRPANVASNRRRWERLPANPRLDTKAALKELAASLTKDWRGREVLLVLDETPKGGGLRCLRVGIAYHKRMITLAAECYPTDSPPLPMPKLICRTLKKLAKLLPAGLRVTLLTDRGLSWPVVMDCLRGLGWGHVMRLQHSTRVMLEDRSGRQKVVAAGELVRRRGGEWRGLVKIFKKAKWRDARLSVVWDRRSKEPWILAADGHGRSGLHAACAYAKRNWCEQSFRDEKSSGFRWSESRVSDPARALRLVLVMALANLLSISLGSWIVKSGRRRDFDPHRERRLSVFQLGLRWLSHLLVVAADGPLPPYLPYLHPS